MPCYTLHSGKISSNFDVDSACGVANSTHPYVQCCVKGDYCMSNGICQYQNDGVPGYYAADCTDPTLQDPACMTRCGGHEFSDLTYDEASGLWACCSYNSDGKKNCSNPTDERFPAPMPSDLATIQYLPSTGTPSYPTATASTTSATSNGTSTPSSHSSSQIGAGAAAGIGVGVGAGVFLIAITAAFLYFRRRKPPQPQQSSTPTSFQPLWVGPEAETHQLDSQQRVELGKPEPRPHELA
ncbi:hypothetical protein BDV38DRAFT_244136 [Aspergillus pseudotamarii]|uniref:Mid2 domain-containing protein n=1 Tax=Aspergillus pseudotamarii TaxID=132259 RepID=A0A5N6SVB1_ASPPS|nr:uncharacterized protein BDV38DRAFT_244136 [Aspergillus pseudotamarii]KAE8138618.1 hypothetical protein BDV38DRAFT_244136 [Aspergillus pseudotamarii]